MGQAVLSCYAIEGRCQRPIPSVRHVIEERHSCFLRGWEIGVFASSKSGYILVNIYPFFKPFITAPSGSHHRFEG